MSLSCDAPSLYTPWVAIDVSPIAILALVMRQSKRCDHSEKELEKGRRGFRATTSELWTEVDYTARYRQIRKRTQQP